jgi:hypothetical protein
LPALLDCAVGILHVDAEDGGMLQLDWPFAIARTQGFGAIGRDNV